MLEIRGGGIKYGRKLESAREGIVPSKAFADKETIEQRLKGVEEPLGSVEKGVPSR